MGLPKLTTCCFCFDLKTGLEVIGVLNAVCSFIMLAAMIVVSSIFGSLQNNKEIEANVDAEAEATGLYVISILICLVLVAKFVFDLLFIYGVVREHAGIIKAYLIVWCVLFLLSNFLYFLHITDFHASVIVFHILIAGFRCYTALLAYSFYEQINTREEL